MTGLSGAVAWRRTTWVSQASSGLVVTPRSSTPLRATSITIGRSSDGGAGAGVDREEVRRQRAPGLGAEEPDPGRALRA